MQGHVASASFDLADEGPVQAAVVGELLLTLAEYLASGWALAALAVGVILAGVAAIITLVG